MQGAVIEGPAWLGNGCVMRQDSKLVRSVLFDYTRMDTNSTLWK